MAILTQPLSLSPTLLVKADVAATPQALGETWKTEGVGCAWGAYSPQGGAYTGLRDPPLGQWS